MKLIIRKDGLKITRRFEGKDSDYTNRVEALKKLPREPLEAILNINHRSRKMMESGQFYTEPAELPWHLKILLSRVLSGREHTAGVHVGIFRSARGYNYYEMESSGREIHLPPPKFENFQKDLQDLGRSKSTRLEHLRFTLLRGAADTLLALAPALEGKSEEAVQEFLQDFTIRTTISNVKDLTPPPAAPVEWELECFLEAEPNVEYRKNLIEVTGKGDSAETVLITSDQFAEAFRGMANLWHEPGFENFLLLAPSGSGKEVLVHALAIGLGLDFVPLVLGKQPSEIIEAKLFGSSQTRALLAAYRREGVANHASRGALIFFDEVDKTDQMVRSILLRLLEAKDYFDGSDGKVYSLRDDLKFGFAASKSPKQNWGRQPRDFLNRIQHTILMGHPVPALPKDAVFVLQSYFTMFWKRACSKALRDPAASSFEKEVVSEIAKWKYADALGRAFAADVCTIHQDKIRDKKFSIRTLRTLVQTVFSTIHNAALGSSNPSGEIEGVIPNLKHIIKES
jgi:Sigma-54 interaction domain